MSDVITKPGLYRQQNGKPADVKWVGDGKVLGFDANGEETMWNAKTGQWCKTATPDFHIHITGPWIPDPPEPPAGFVVQDRETYKAQKGDKLWNAMMNGYTPVIDSVGKTATEIEQSRRSWFPVFIASPIPKPFSISEHGPGVYETRDGREAVVTERGTYDFEQEWTGIAYTPTERRIRRLLLKHCGLSEAQP